MSSPYLGENEEGKTTAVKLNYLVKEKTAQLTVTDMNFDLETKIFTGKTKPFASVYITSPVDENFGEGVTKADKDGNFTRSGLQCRKNLRLCFR